MNGLGSWSWIAVFVLFCLSLVPGAFLVFLGKSALENAKKRYWDLVFTDLIFFVIILPLFVVLVTGTIQYLSTRPT